MDEGAVGWLADRAAIEDLGARYNRSFDDLDVEAWCSTFTNDGMMSLDGRQWRGRAELAHLIDRIGFGMVHVTANAVIAIDGDTATQECSLLLLERSRDRTPVRLLTTGRYRDALVRTDQGWRFERREAVTDSDLARRPMP